MIHRLFRSQLLETDLEQAWAFFSDPGNLQRITPDWLDFEILSGADRAMHPGQILTYRIRALFGIPHLWVTEITHVLPRRFFVDEQRQGPYAFWHHQHHFEETKAGVQMTDLLHYTLPMGFFGNLFHPVIRRKLEAIFDHRHGTLACRFPVSSSPQKGPWHE